MGGGVFLNDHSPEPAERLAAGRAGSRLRAAVDCRHCGTSFQGSRRDAAFCSRKCSAAFYRRSRTQKCAEVDCVNFVVAKGLCSTHYNRTMPSRHGLYDMECAQCGATVRKHRRNDRQNVFCSFACRDEHTHAESRARRRAMGVALMPFVARRKRVTPKAPKPRRWVSGPCSWCGEHFVLVDQLTARYCSVRCSRNAAKAANGRFVIPAVVRVAIYERDLWTCQLCDEPVDPSLPTSDRWAATLDHIVCQSWTSEPDHSPDNLRLAHRWCNSVRSDESHYTADMLRVGA